MTNKNVHAELKMSTARTEFFQSLLDIASSAPTKEHLSSEIEKLLNHFRVQTKPGKMLAQNQTAREALLNELCALYKQSPPSSEHIKHVISAFRMQLKKPGDGKQPSEAAQKKLKSPPLSRASRMQLPNLAAEKRKLLRENTVERIAGGPKKKNSTRGVCPKCHSSGVVLAKSFSGDDYFSCIYCGFQAYKRQVDADIDLPLAAELLGRRFDENDRE